MSILAAALTMGRYVSSDEKDVPDRRFIGLRRMQATSPSFVTLSPSLPILEWILKKLKRLKQANAQAVRKIFCSLEAKEGPEFNRFHNLYSLIPRFKQSRLPTAERYDIYCDLPPIQIIDENGKFTAVTPGRNPRNIPRFRVFNVQEALLRRRTSRGR
ncbi:hypothetical protein C8R45DRAFT_940883 [Mycena sanguinolenta]|nr:hypothetical protein C8R45DRAFT_940883 [Mycena sanguinolenta]